jgi:hypothetical protein
VRGYGRVHARNYAIKHTLFKTHRRQLQMAVKAVGVVNGSPHAVRIFPDESSVNFRVQLKINVVVRSSVLFVVTPAKTAK